MNSFGKFIQRTAAAFSIGFLFLSLFHCGMIMKEDEIDLEQEIFHLVNNHRASLGLQRLEWNETIALQCRRHSQNMADDVIPFGHSGFEDRASVIGMTIPFSRIQENIAYAFDYWGTSSLADEVMSTWLENLDHISAIEGDYDLSGVGVCRDGMEYYFTQIFLKRK